VGVVSSGPLQCGCSVVNAVWERGSSAEDQHSAIATVPQSELENLTDESLVRMYRTTANTEVADQYINELFRRNHAKIARWCVRFTGERDEALDLAQEVFARAFQNLNLFRGQSKFSTWLFIIARNQCINAARARRQPELAENDDVLATLPDLSLEMPDSALERSEAAKLARDLMNEALDETEKRVFVLHYADELGVETITRVLGLKNASGAKAYLVSARRKLLKVVGRRRALEAGKARWVAHA
jgi:RNA polymerase sigma-70 factor, ECF subfamily